ncbi:hypothetical protein QBZ16_003954 [Prototheca wickerhamii]|uniref:Uncharacterized protein n=1 Tax=Prototheca wickerhamii TaxID=3111 RepID=A0AAD9II25_PROWI|nr:hypothetical protein QBZ16_003954 [Prototheca wickerhamii]
MADQRPNPIVQAANSSSLPRTVRARVGATTDPVPEGKVIDAEPELSSPIKREVHDAEKAQKEAEELGHEDPAAYQREMQRMQHEATKDRGNYNDKVFLNSSVKQMESRGGANDFQGSKHMDSVYRSK